jgi:phosphoadenosine phosphosulfate reductase
MPVLDRVRPGDAEAAAQLAASFDGRSAQDVLRAAIDDFFPGRIALVSSFGADSVALLHMASLIDRAVPVVFVSTGHLFAETLAYRDHLIARLGLTDVKTFEPDARDLAETDPENFLWARDQDACCKIRKVIPLARALEGHDAWISGRKRFQADTRAALPLFEAEGSRTKVNPLAAWSPQDILAYMVEHDLPRHELVAKNYLSIGCVPCTSQVRPGEDARAGRWRGKGKVECGIHTDFPEAGAGI